MKYEKPQIVLLGTALNSVRGNCHKDNGAQDGCDGRTDNTAYEADE